MINDTNTKSCQWDWFISAANSDQHQWGIWVRREWAREWWNELNWKKIAVSWEIWSRGVPMVLIRIQGGDRWNGIFMAAGGEMGMGKKQDWNQEPKNIYINFLLPRHSHRRIENIYCIRKDIDKIWIRYVKMNIERIILRGKWIEMKLKLFFNWTTTIEF